LLAGMLLGSMGLKADLRKAQQKIENLQRQVRHADKTQVQLGGITSMLNIPSSKEPVPARAAGRRHIHAEVHTNAPASDSEALRLAEIGPGTNNLPPPRSMRQDIETAANVWKMRSDLARENFLATATSNDQQAVRFDVLMMAMNVRLSNSVRTWVDFVKTNQTVTPECGVRMMNDLSGVIVQTYTDLDRDLPEWREKTEGKFNVLDFVDPQAAMPMTEIEGVLATQRWDHAESLGDIPDE
jgi:hypothetical protein